MSELPAGWVKSTLGEIGEYLNGRGFKKTEWRETGRPIIRIQNLTGTSNAFNHFDGEPEEHYVARRGDILVSWAATLDVFIWNGPEAVVNQHIFKVSSYINRDFHRYLLLFALDDLKRETHGSGMVHITKGRFERTPIKLPPLAEQARMVAAIEEQFSRLDMGVAELRRVQHELAQLRASTLGSLLTSQDGANWPTVEIGEIMTRGHYGTSTKCTVDGTGLPVLRIPNIQQGSISLSNLKFARDPSVDLTGTLAAEGDLLIIRTNGSRSLIGRAAVVPALPQSMAFASYLIQLKVDANLIAPSYLSTVLASPKLRIQIEQLAATTAGQHNISLSKLASLRVPLPPLDEQRQALAATEQTISLIGHIETTVTHSLARTDRLRAAILSTAFAGKLASQNPSDEAASLLLERIQVERASSGIHQQPKRRQRRKVVT